MVFSFVDVYRLSQEKLDRTKGVAVDFFYLERMKNFYNCETVKSFLLRLNETLERVSASLARKFIDMLNNFLVSSGALKHGEYMINIKEALEMGIPERVKRMREEIAAEVATKATAEATATTALKKDKGFVNILKYRIFDIIKHRFVSIPYNLIHNISTINDINILLDFISISEKVKNIDEINVLIEKKINKNQ